MIESVSGIRTMVTNAGRLSSIDAKFERRRPSETSTARPAPAPPRSRSRAPLPPAEPTKKHGRKHSAVTTDARPVRRAHADAGDALDVGRARRRAGQARAERRATHRRSGRVCRLSGRPSARSGLTALATPMNVDSESKRSVKRIDDDRRQQRQLQRADDVELQKRGREVRRADDALRRHRVAERPGAGGDERRSTARNASGLLRRWSMTATSTPTSRNAAR